MTWKYNRRNFDEDEAKEQTRTSAVLVCSSVISSSKFVQLYFDIEEHTHMTCSYKLTNSDLYVQ